MNNDSRELNAPDNDEDELPGGRKKRLLKKAPEAPKRFKTAYICFVMEKMDGVKEESPKDEKVTELMKKLAIMWQNVPMKERLKYDAMAEIDKIRYLNEMAKYSGPMHVPNKRLKKPQGAPKRAMSSFLSFSQLMRPEIRLQYPNLKNTDVSSVLAQKWHEASDEAKRPHIERELKDREKYHEEMARWKAEESERVEAKKAEIESELLVTEDAAKFQASLQYASSSQLPPPSLWAAMIDVNESSGFGSLSPLFDEAMDGFWDTDVEGENYVLVPFTAPFKTQQSAPSTFHCGTKSGGLPTHSDVGKGQRMAKRVKDRRSHEAPSPQPPLQLDMPPTARQVEVQQRRQQQQHQYQMYQQHILNQKQKTDKGDEMVSLEDEMPFKRSKEEESRPPREITSVGSIVEGGRLYSQAQANQRNSYQDAQLKFQQPAYQGMQRMHAPRPPEWAPGLLGLMGSAPSSLPPVPQFPSYGSAFTGGFYNSPPTHTTAPQPCLGPQAASSAPSEASTGTLNPSAQSMRPFQFEEQDQLSVMQTLMAVHRASASKVGDYETIRSLDRIQMGQREQAPPDNQQRGQPSGYVKPSTAAKQEERTRGPSDMKSSSSFYSSSKCAPLSVQQQERQNQTERQQLTDRQNKQMQDMLLLQEREQVEQRQEHSSSMVTASNENSLEDPALPTH